SEAEARDAAELVEINYAAREAVTDVARAAALEAPQIWPEAPGNIAVDWHPYGGKPEDRAELDRIFAGAAHIATVRLVNQRIVMAPMEPRGGVAVYEPETDRYVLQVASQSAFAMRQHVARTMGVPVDKLRVVSRDVGGAFGMRTSGYPEYPAMLLASKVLGRPVRWLSTRQEGFLTDNQARDTIIEARLAMDTDGKFLALDIDSIAALGAYHTSHGAFIATVNVAGFAARQETSETAGKRRGLGVSCFLEIAGGQPGEGAAVAFPGSSKLLLAIGVQASGQGHRTVYRRLVADYLGIPAEVIEVAH